MQSFVELRQDLQEKMMKAPKGEKLIKSLGKKKEFGRLLVEEKNYFGHFFAKKNKYLDTFLVPKKPKIAQANHCLSSICQDPK